MKTVCVFAGSSRGVSPAYAEAARELGREIAKRNLRMVYGGGNVGLMGECAHAAQEGGSEVVGVIPERLMPKEVSGQTVGDIRVVKDMHERKALMAKQRGGQSFCHRRARRTQRLASTCGGSCSSHQSRIPLCFAPALPERRLWRSKG